MTDHDEDGSSPARRAAATAARQMVQVRLPPWLQTIGSGAWLLLGIVGVIAVILLLLALVTQILIPLVIAAVLAAILVPVVDRLEEWRVPRWLGATLVLIVSLSLVVVVVALVVSVIVSQSDGIWNQLTAGFEELSEQVGGTSTEGAQLAGVARSVVAGLSLGLFGSLLSSATILVVGFVLALFVLLFLLKDWAPITTWSAGHIGLPTELGVTIFQGTVHAFRGYARGLTLIGVANGVVVGVGALVLGVPLAGTIGVVSFVTSYVPYIGAVFAGAFAVFIALGENGLGTALAMLAIVLLANNTIQNLLEPFAFGRSLSLHPLVVLIATTTGTLLFGLMGAILAAPLTSAFINALDVLRNAGLFGIPDEEPETGLLR